MCVICATSSHEWMNADVLQAILAVQRFWYDKGIDGFRLDVFNAYCKDPDFRNNPRRKDLLGYIGGVFYGYIGQEHIYDRDRPELFRVLSAFRALADEYDAVLIGETLDERFGIELWIYLVTYVDIQIPTDFKRQTRNWFARQHGNVHDMSTFCL